jgi:hypothetical protein
VVDPSGQARRGAAIAASQQFGAANQTDAFLISQNGALNVFWLDSAGTVSGPEVIGTAGFAPSGGAVAACEQFGAGGQTDVFVVNNTGPGAPGWPVVCWVVGSGSWGGPKALVEEV